MRRELGPGFLERIYKNALLIAIRQQGLMVDVERLYDVIFREKLMGWSNEDLLVDQTMILELKCCESLIRAHQAQLFNYLKVSIVFFIRIVLIVSIVPIVFIISIVFIVSIVSIVPYCAMSF